MAWGMGGMGRGRKGGSLAALAQDGLGAMLALAAAAVIDGMRPALGCVCRQCAQVMGQSPGAVVVCSSE